MNSAEWVGLLLYPESGDKMHIGFFINEIIFSKLFHCETNKHCTTKMQWFFIRKFDYQKVMYT